MSSFLSRSQPKPAMPPAIEKVGASSSEGALTAPSLNPLADYNLVTLLTIFVSQPSKADFLERLQNVQQNVHEWQSWEAKQIEDAVAAKLRAHDPKLPSDSTRISAIGRNDYRLKLLQYCREKAATWLTLSSSTNGTRSDEGLPDDVAAKIVQYLSTLLPPSAEESERVFHPLVRTLVYGPSMQRSTSFTVIQHTYDDVAAVFRTIVTQLRITLDIVAEKGSDRIKVNSSHVLTSSNFSHDIWAQHSQRLTKDFLNDGRMTLKNYTLHLAPVA